MNRILGLVVVCIAVSCITASGQNTPGANTNTDAAKVYINTGRALAKDDKFEEALKAFEKASELQPDNEEAIMGQIGMCMELNRPDDALKIIDKWIELKPDDPKRWFYKAMAAGETGRPEESLKAFDKLIQLQPNEGVNWIGKGECLAALNRNDEALKAFNKALTMNPERTDVWSMKGLLQARMGKYDDAITSCNKAMGLLLKGNANYTNYMANYTYNRACVYALKGDKTNALVDLKKAIELYPSFKNQATKDENFKNLYDDMDFKNLTE